jgi:cytochrome P450
MFGGVETTASALMVGTFYMLKNPDMLKRLKKELHDLWPVMEQEPELRDLEKLPYLVRSIKTFIYSSG